MPGSPVTRMSCHTASAMPAYDSASAIAARRVTGCERNSADSSDDDRRIEEEHEPLERRGDVLQAEEVEQARQVIADEAEAEQQPPVARARCVSRRGARPAHHAIDDEERRRVEHAQRHQRHRIDRRPRVRELDQDRLEREAEHAEHRQQRSRATRSVPPDAAAPGGEQDQQPEGDPVPRERHEVVAADVADQPADAEERRDECRDEPDRRTPEGRRSTAARDCERARRRRRRAASEWRGRTRTRSQPVATARTACRR